MLLALLTICKTMNPKVLRIISKASNTLIISLLPSFYALVSILKHCMSRICLTCGFWEVVDEVEPIALLLSNLGSYFYVMLILPCYARRRGLGLSVSMIDVRVVK